MSDNGSREAQQDAPFDVEREGVRASDEQGVGMVLHEERLKAGVESFEAGRVEVRKRIVADEVTVTLPIRREVVDLVRVFADGSEEVLEAPESTWVARIEDRTFGAAGHGREAGEPLLDSDKGAPSRDAETKADTTAETEGATYDVVLHEERPVITTEIFAIERVRLAVTGEQQIVQVQDEVRREVAEVDAPQELRAEH